MFGMSLGTTGTVRGDVQTDTNALGYSGSSAQGKLSSMTDYPNMSFPSILQLYLLQGFSNYGLQM